MLIKPKELPRGFYVPLEKWDLFAKAGKDIFANNLTNMERRIRYLGDGDYSSLLAKGIEGQGSKHLEYRDGRLKAPKTYEDRSAKNSPPLGAQISGKQAEELGICTKVLAITTPLQ